MTEPAFHRPVALGALGWEWPAWSDAFYPPDMPEEWRLTYYNTQFDCVFLNQADWQSAGADVYRSWAEDTHGDFVFLLEAVPPEAAPAVLAGRAILVSRDDPGLLWFDRDTPLKTLAEHLGAGRQAPLYLLSRDGDLAQLERVRTLLEVMGL